MRFPDRKTVETLRTQFPVGCRVVLDRMEDAQAPALGTQESAVVWTMSAM